MHAMSGLVDAWCMGHEANLYLLDNLPAAWLSDRYGARTRDVRAQFQHMHDVRVYWMEQAAPDLGQGAGRLGKDATPTKAQLKKALKASSKVVEAFLERAAETGKVPQWNGPPETFLGYLIAHEAHHRGLIMVSLRACDRKPSKELVYGQWDWGKRSSNRAKS
jgi:uncharacterized damage-inducible protein DinB